MIFALIFAIIMIGFIFVFAVPQIASFISIGGQAQINKMIKDIETKVDYIYWNAGYGSSEILTITLPSKTRICFINPYDLGDYYYAEKWMDWRSDKAINVLIKKEGYNLWYYHDGDQNGYKVKHLQLDENAHNFCIIGGMEIYLENEGDRVTVSRMESR